MVVSECKSGPVCQITHKFKQHLWVTTDSKHAIFHLLKRVELIAHESHHVISPGMKIKFNLISWLENCVKND